MEDIQSMINEKSDKVTKEKLTDLLIQCLELIDGTRTGKHLEIDVSHNTKIPANTSDVFRGLFAAIEPIVLEKNRAEASKQFMEDFCSLQGQFDNLLK